MLSRAPSSRGSSSGLRKAWRKTAWISVWVALPPAPCERVMFCSRSRGRPRRARSMLSSTCSSRETGSTCACSRTAASAQSADRSGADPSIRGRSATGRLLDPLAGEPAEVVVRRAGALGGDHAGADRRLGGARGAEHLALPGLQDALEHLAALAGLRVGDPAARDLEDPL